MIGSTATAKTTLVGFSGRSVTEVKEAGKYIYPESLDLDSLSPALKDLIVDQPAAELASIGVRIDDVEGRQDTVDSTIAVFANHIFDLDNPHGVTKEQVGLSNVDNTADEDKPISTETLTVLDGYASVLLAHADATTGIHGVSGSVVGTSGAQTLSSKTLASPTITGTPVGLTKSHVGLGNVDNTSDAAKPVSTATTTALSGKANTSHTHAAADIASGTLAIARVPTGTNSATVATGDRGLPTGGSTGQRLVKASGTNYDVGFETVYTTPTPVIVNDSTNASYSSGTVDLITSGIVLPSGGKWLVRADGWLRSEGVGAGLSAFLLGLLIDGTASTSPNLGVEQGVDGQNGVEFARIITGTGVSIPVILRMTWVTGTIQRYTCRMMITAVPV